MQFKFFFVLKEWRQYRPQKLPLFFYVTPLNNADRVFAAI